MVNIKKICFEDYEQMACSITNTFNGLKIDEDIAVIAKYKEINEIFKNLVCIGYDICSIDIKIPDLDGYNDEYILSVSSDGLWLEKFKQVDGKYIPDESTMIYILDNCSSAVIPQCRGNILIEVGIANEEEFECEECCGCCECDNELAIESDDNMHGFTVNRSDENSCYSYSFYSTSEKLVEEMARLFK